MSRHDDPQAVLQIAMSYSRRIVGYDRTVAATRRDLSPPMIRLMRSPLVDEEVDPWKHSDELPVISGGLLAELVYAGAPRVIDELSLLPDDPAAAHLAGMRSLAAIPHFEHGEALDMVFHLSRTPSAFARDRLGQMVLLSSLFGQAVWDSVRARDLVEAEQSMKEQYEIIAQVSNTVLDEALQLKDHSRELQERVRQRTAELAEANLETIYMLAVASEAKDEDTGQHVRRIQRLANAIARQIGMIEADADAPGLAAMLHDVGKIHV